MDIKKLFAVLVVGGSVLGAGCGKDTQQTGSKQTSTQDGGSTGTGDTDGGEGGPQNW